MTLDLWFGPTHASVSGDATTLDQLRRDFSWFATKREPVTREASFSCLLQAPDAGGIRGPYFFSHFGGKVYGWGERRWVLYPDTLLFWDAAANNGFTASLDGDRLYHYAYYLILAIAGKELDELGRHRLHALGVAVAGRPALFSMPISGGKTTLGLKLMEDPAVSLYSEDTPLIGNRGEVYSFAVRLSLREGYRAEIPEGFRRVKNDPVFGRKILVDLEYHGLERIETVPGRGALVFWCYKSSDAAPRVEPIPRWRALARLLLYIVVGKDCPQRAEVFLRLSVGGWQMLWTLLTGRARAAWGLWRSSRSYTFFMSPDIPANAEFIKHFIRTQEAPRLPEAPRRPPA